MHKRHSDIYFSILLALPVLFTACTRPLEDIKKSSTVSLSFPKTISDNTLHGKLSSMSAGTSQLTHVSINVSGSGIASPMVLVWDSCRDCSNPPPTPSSFELIVPAGAGRLVQVLTVYENSSTNKMTFSYGDRTTDINGTEVSVSVPMTVLNTGNVIDGQVAGRYITSSNADIDHGPTGSVALYYRPAGKPSMIVSREEIMDGWFSFFMLSGLQFEYVVENTGELLWGRAVSLDDSLFAYSSNSNQNVMKLFVPDHVFASDRNGSISDNQTPATIVVWGYWALPGSSMETYANQRKVCYTSPTYTVNKYELYRTTSLGTTNPAAGTAMTLSTSYGSNYPPLANLVSVDGLAAPLQSTLLLLGGAGMASSSCGGQTMAGGNDFKYYIAIGSINYDSKDYLVGFQPPFKFNANNNIFDVTNASNYKRLSAYVLPGIESLIDGFRIYKSSGFNDDMWLENPRCSDIANGSTTFSLGQSSATPFAPSSGSLQIDSNISIYASQGMAAVVCPVKNGVTQNWGGTFVGSYYFGENVPSQLKIFNPSTLTAISSVIISEDTCQPIRVRGYSADGVTPAKFAPYSSYAISFLANSVYSDPSCSMVMTSYSLGMYAESEIIFYIKATPQGAPVNLTVTNSVDSGVTSTVALTTAIEASIAEFSFWMPTTIKPGSCVPVILMGKDVNLRAATYYSSINDINLTADGGGFYSTGNCTTPISYGALSPYHSSTMIFYQAPAIPGSYVLEADSSIAVATGEITITVAN